MPFTVQEIENIANATIDYHIKDGILSQTIQDKPLYKAMKARRKTFPGSKEFITGRVKGAYTTTIQGFTHDDTVTYSNPANVKQVQYPWFEVHAGIEMTFTELKKQGISVVDTNTGKTTAVHSQAEKVQLANLLDDKVEDMAEGYARGMNLMFWRDGTQDAKLSPGVRSILLDDPTTGTVVGGIDQSANSWWRNRASLAIDAATPSNQNLVNKLQAEIRQLRRYGGKPNTFLCGSDFLDAFEKELRNKGNYTETGWAKNGGRIDASVADLAFKGVALEYDPTLDDESLTKYGFWMDMRRLCYQVMEGEEDKMHNPSRPEDKYVFYRAMTWTGGIFCNQRNCHGVYSIA